MKRLFWLMLLIFPCVVHSQPTESSTGISWTDGLTWEQVKEKAKSENKFIFVGPQKQ